MLPIAVLTVTGRRRITRRRVCRRRRISRGRVRRHLGFSWRWRWCRMLTAIAHQLAVVVADITDAMRDVERRRLLAAPMRPAADRSQCAAVHPKLPAALLVGTGR